MLLKGRVPSHELFSCTRSSMFVFPYLALLILVNIFGVFSYSPRDIVFKRFFFFWHSYEGTTGLLTWIMATNCLVAVLLWLEFRAYRGTQRRLRAPYLYFVSCALLLVALQAFYLRVSVIDPGYKALIYDLRTPVALPWSPGQ